MKKIIYLFLIATLLQSCRGVVSPNEWCVTTTTCWNTYTVTKAGSTIPRLFTNCDRMIILPATEMAAEFECETKFKGRVAGKVMLTYQWRILDPIAFVQSAKSVTSSKISEDYKIDPNVLEGIENSVVDKMIIDIIREYTPDKDAGIDEKNVESDILAASKLKFTNRGVDVFNMSVNIVFSPQTEEALDVISALKFYADNNEAELGRKVIQAKAGATHITVAPK